MDKETLKSRNYFVEKHNLVLVCRFVIKSVLDKASIGLVEEDSPDIINLLAIIEHILNHNLKVNRHLFGDDTVSFWSFIKESCSSYNKATIGNVLSIAGLKNNVSRGRAWLRLALMEKKLANYLKHAVEQESLLLKYYSDGAIITSDEMQLLIEDLVGLNAVDFNFCLRGNQVKLDGRLLVDYSPYLRFHLCHEGVEHDLQEALELHKKQSSAGTSNSTTETLDPHCNYDLKERHTALQKAFRTTNEQKGYLEEMMKKYEKNLEQKQIDCEDLKQQNALAVEKHEKELKQYESFILELQNEITCLKANNKELQRSIKLLCSKQDSQDQGVPMHDLSLTSASLDDLVLREDNFSLRPMHGSLISETDSLGFSGGVRSVESASIASGLMDRMEFQRGRLNSAQSDFLKSSGHSEYQKLFNDLTKSDEIS